MMGNDERIRVFAPASVANLGPGFDVLGLALAAPGDVVTARRVAQPGVRIAAVRGDDGRLPRETGANTAGIAAEAVLRETGIATGIELELDKGLPIGSGLGSSAASAAAAALAVNLLLGSPLRKTELVGPCLAAEEVVSGRHADNVAAALLGGLILVRSTDPLDLVRLPLMHDLIVTVVTPAFDLPTREARRAVPEQLPLARAVAQAANLGALVSGLHSGDVALLARSLSVQIAEPARAPLIPGGAEAIAAARGAGAIGRAISGAGPSIFALSHSRRVAARAGEAMQHAFRTAGLASSVTQSPADCPGARKL